MNNNGQDPTPTDEESIKRIEELEHLCDEIEDVLNFLIPPTT